MRVHALCLMLAAGCMSEEAIDNVEEAGDVEGEIRVAGGTPTNTRPEIGQYVWFGGGCTATLIAPSVVITAAACLTPQYTATMPYSGSVFVFTDSSGVSRSVTVDSVHSFGTQRWERTGAGSPWFTDIALLHLSAPVPASQAVPAEIAVQEPVSGQGSVMFGFGCSSQADNSGIGTKRRRSFTFGTNTNAFCAGDYGGPAVFESSGAIWGISVGSIGRWPDSPVDAWADVPFYKKQIEAVVRRWEGVEVGWDRAGHDYMNYAPSSLSSCKTDCENDGNCRAFTFRPSDNRCWRKSAASEPIVNPLTITGLPLVKQTGLDRFGGGDYQQLFVPSSDDCLAACGRDSRCASWNFNGGQCWLKNDVPATISCPTCISGVMRRGQELGWDRPGNSYFTAAAANVEQCAARCAADSKCESYSQVNGFCSLKDSVPPAIATSSSLPIGSGVRRGLEVNSDRPGMTYSMYSTQELTPNECQAACARDSSCQSWSYLAPTPSNGNATCSLKNGVPTKTTRTGTVSGIKGLEMLP